MEYLPSDFLALVRQFADCLGYAPNGPSFATLVLGWVLCHGRHTLSGVVRAAGPFAPKSHDAYQNFFSKSKWNMDTLGRGLFHLLVAAFASEGSPLMIAGDDTLAKHRGPKIWGAGLYRDAVRSSRRHPAYAWGLNWVVLVMVVPVRLLNKEHLIAFPVLARLNVKDPPAKRKGRGARHKKTTVTLMADMIRIVAQWMPQAPFLFCGDGAYACLAGALPANVHLVSRMRCDAALYAPGPKRRRKGQRGPLRKKGKRLPTPQRRAQRVHHTAWRAMRLVLYGETVERLVYDFTALWYEVRPDQPVRIVCVRDPKAKRNDEFFFTTDLRMTLRDILQSYAGRWSIEVVFRECKQYLGMNDPQARTKNAVLRMTPFCLWLNALIKYWFLHLPSQHQQAALPTDPWYTHKDTVSFQDMLTALRTHFWHSLFSTKSTYSRQFAKILPFIVKSLAKVA